MKRENGDQQERAKPDRINSAHASDFIRSAERFIASGKLSLAKEQILNAQAIDPANTYIPAILDRLEVLERSFATETKTSGSLQTQDDKQAGRYLSVTVGAEFKGGVKGKDEKPTPTPKEIQSRIRRLTSAAENFLETGAYKNAFESLMKAYLLDPMSPFVVACEKTVLPAWERSRTSGSSQHGKHRIHGTGKASGST